MAVISASVYSADLSELRASVKRAEKDGAGQFHVDIIDDHFTSGFGFPIPFVKYLKDCTDLPVDVHLQIEHPERHLDSLINAGADSIIFHLETALQNAGSILKEIKGAGIHGGLALCPDTEFAHLEKYLPLCDNVLLLGVHPGNTGEDFLPVTIERVRVLRRMIEEQKCTAKIFVDGQIQKESGMACLRAGADILVIGKAFFQNSNRAELMQSLKNVF